MSEWSTGDRIANLLASHRFRFADEIDLQDGLEQLLRDQGWPVEREVRLPGGRIDFRVDGTVGVEIKVAGSVDQLRRQLVRYAGDVDELLVVTTRRAHAALGADIDGTPCRVIVLRSGAW